MAKLTYSALLIWGALAGTGTVLADEQAAIDGCIDRLREVDGPDGANGGQVLSSDYSEAGTLVMLQDAGGSVWRCLAASDGTVEEIAVANAADDGGGAIAGTAEGATNTLNVKFGKGSSGASYDGSLTPGSSTRYVLGARKGQVLSVQIKGADISHQIFNPDQSFLLDMISASKNYKGQLWQTGNHIVEVINRGNGAVQYKISLSIE